MWWLSRSFVWLAKGPGIFLLLCVENPNSVSSSLEALPCASMSPIHFNEPNMLQCASKRLEGERAHRSAWKHLGMYQSQWDCNDFSSLGDSSIW